MGIFNKKDETTSDHPVVSTLDQQISEQAKRLGLAVDELKNLGAGKRCPKYGITELLHARRVRGGKLVVFNISEKYRGEKISEGRKKIKANKTSADVPADESIKK